PEESMNVTCRASTCTGRPAVSASVTASVSSSVSATSISPESTSRVRSGSSRVCTEPAPPVSRGVSVPELLASGIGPPRGYEDRTRVDGPPVGHTVDDGGRGDEQLCGTEGGGQPR